MATEIDLGPAGEQELSGGSFAVYAQEIQLIAGLKKCLHRGVEQLCKLKQNSDFRHAVPFFPFADRLFRIANGLAQFHLCHLMALAQVPQIFCEQF